MSHESPSFDILNSMINAIGPDLLAGVIAKYIKQPAEDLDNLRGAVELAIATRLNGLQVLPDSGASWSEGSSQVEAEAARLRSVRGLLPFLGTQALTYLLGMLRIDGRPGDYIEPPSVLPYVCHGDTCGAAVQPHERPEPSDEERIGREVSFALTGADTFENEVATVWVFRPAVDAAATAIRDRRGREVEVRRQPDHTVKVDGDPWMIRDLLIVQPPGEPEEPSEHDSKPVTEYEKAYPRASTRDAAGD